MRYRRLDSNHDYMFGKGKDDYLVDSTGNPNAIAQAIKTRLLLFLGEWWEDQKDGLPLWQKILGTRNNEAVINRLITTRIKGLVLPDGSYGVKSVSQVTSSYDVNSRAYSFSCAVDTTFGKLVVTNKDQGAAI